MIDASVLANEKAAEVLQRSDLRKPRHGARQPHRERRRPESAGTRVAEHAGLRVVDRPLDKLDNGLVAVGTRLRVQAERSLAVLNPRVQRPAVRAETQTEQVVIVRTVPHQKRPIFLPGKLLFSFHSCDWTPIPSIVD